MMMTAFNCGSDLAALDFDFSCDNAVACMLCDEMFLVSMDDQPLLSHLVNCHKVVISDVQEVADLRQYILYWRKLKDLELRHYCVVINTNSEPGALAPTETFYLLCNKLPEDKKLRETLKQMKLKFIVDQKERERNDHKFSRQCIYCSEVVGGGVAQCLDHLTFHHGFTLGNPDNIVFGAKLLDLLYDKLHRLQCLFCEKTFKDHVILREHMRKKQHRCLNPKNKMYDRFYLLNYLTPGTPWEKAKLDLDSDQDSFGFSEDVSDEQLWTDWRDEDTAATKCLFCQFNTTKAPQGLFQHMKLHHQFDFEKITTHFDFYQKVKVVNFLRCKILNCECNICNLKFRNNDELLDHMSINGHFNLPDNSKWDLAEFMQPVIEGDAFLCQLEDSDLEKVNDWNQIVLPEEVPSVDNSVLIDYQIRDDITRTEGSPLDFATMCLFCRYTATSERAQCQVVNHMKSQHCFDMIAVLKDVNFYAQVRLINFIRWKTSRDECYVCNEKFTMKRNLEEHRVLAGHNALPDAQCYHDERWLLPVIEGDGLLQRLKVDWESDDENLSDAESKVTSESNFVLPSTSILTDKKLCQELREDSVHGIDSDDLSD